jgi:zinc D-Ala-D-Ala carboxypeptidase
MKNKDLVGVLTLLLALAVLGGGFLYYSHTTDLSEKLASSEAALNETRATLAHVENENVQLSDALAAEKARNDAFEERLGEISGTVGKLDKLARTDPELLQKYSKVYFLNENYVPSALSQIPVEWTHGKEEEYFHTQVWPHLEDLLDDARSDGIELRVVSGYRAFEKQAQLKSAYTVQYGSGANTFSADQGYSEHQLGTAIDFTTETLGASWSSSFDATEAYAWLSENAHEYGFILSYPEGNAYYAFEPWHWRYVGEALAEDLHDRGAHFYDLDQRAIDEYLVDFFD